MGLSNAGKRPLPFPLKYPETVFGVIPDDGFSAISLSDIFPDNETRVSLELKLSLDEYVALASAIDVGRDIAFSEDSDWVWWIWVRAIRGETVSCEQMIDCITNDAEVRAAFYEWAVSQGVFDPNTIDDNEPVMDILFPPSARSQGINIPPDGCDKDILWGGIVELVTRLDDNARTILETAITYNDIAERLGNILSAIPIIGNTLASLQKTFTEIIPDVYALYNAYSSQANRDDIACAIFEIVCLECRYPTYNELYNVYAANAVGGLTGLETITLRAVVEGFVASGSLAASVAYNTVIILELFALYAGSRFLSAQGYDAITFYTLLGEDDPSNDWELLCEGCEPPETWCYEIDFTQGSLGLWQLMCGTLTASGVESSYVNGLAEQAWAILDAGEAFSWESMEIEYQYTVSPTGVNDKVSWVLAGGYSGSLDGSCNASLNTTIQFAEIDPDENTNIQTKIVENAPSASRRYATAKMLDYGASGQKCYIRRVKLYGSGSPPIGFESNC